MQKFKKKPKIVQTGAPGWMVTFGDMMSLILCFFVMLFSLSELKKNKLYDVAMAVTEFAGPEALLETRRKDSRDQTFMEVLESTTQRAYSKYRKKGGSHARGVPGTDLRVSVVDEGMRVDLPERADFPRGSARLTPEAKEHLRAAAQKFVGMRNRLDIRGHDDTVPLEAGEVRGARWRARDLDSKWDLAYFRARAVADFLIEQGVVPQRIRLTSCGRMEPTAPDVFSRTAQSRNRRVEIVVTEEQIPAEGDNPGPR